MRRRPSWWLVTTLSFCGDTAPAYDVVATATTAATSATPTPATRFPVRMTLTATSFRRTGTCGPAECACPVPVSAGAGLERIDRHHHKFFPTGGQAPKFRGRAVHRPGGA